ncbi:MAG: heavy-metal-associated domain-containing protein [Chloroflexota bacterium]
MIAKKTYKLDGMHCPNCAISVESIEDDLPGIRDISASYHKGQVVVEFDEAQVTEEQITTALSRKGYHLRIPEA